jgi:glycosyltransferase involved in cell wall biosynthesis
MEGDLSTNSRVSHPRVSFVVPTHNYAHFVDEAVLSLLGQTFTGLEVIIIDDASTDDTPAVLRQFASDGRVRLIRHQRNIGHIRTYNEGLALARGEFVGLLSADDLCLTSEAVARQVAVFDSDPDIGFVYSALTFVDDAAGIVGEHGHRAKDGVRDGLDEFHDLVFGNHVPASGTLVRASCHADVGYYDERLPHAGDWDLWLRLAARYKVGYVSAPLYGYRVHGGNMHHQTITPVAADDDHRLTLERAFGALPHGLERQMRGLRRAAFRAIAVRAVDLERKRRRRLPGWIRAWQAVATYPELLVSPAAAAAIAKLVAVTVLQPSLVDRLRGLSRSAHRT